MRKSEHPDMYYSYTIQPGSTWNCDGSFSQHVFRRSTKHNIILWDLSPFSGCPVPIHQYSMSLSQKSVNSEHQERLFGEARMSASPLPTDIQTLFHKFSLAYKQWRWPKMSYIQSLKQTAKSAKLRLTFHLQWYLISNKIFTKPPKMLASSPGKNKSIPTSRRRSMVEENSISLPLPWRSWPRTTSRWPSTPTFHSASHSSHSSTTKGVLEANTTWFCQPTKPPGSTKIIIMMKLEIQRNKFIVIHKSPLVAHLTLAAT